MAKLSLVNLEMKTEDLMRKDFVSFQADDMLETILKKLAQNHVTSAPVFDGTEFIGILSDSDIVRYFSPKKFMFLWKKDKPTPIDELKKVTAKSLVSKPDLVLKSGQTLESNLVEMAKVAMCIPVMDSNNPLRLIGVIRGEDIINFFLTELAKGAISESPVGPDASGGMSTEIDTILKRVNTEGQIEAWRLANDLSVSVKTIERLGESLAGHHLVEIKYSFFKGAILKRVVHEKS